MSRIYLGDVKETIFTTHSFSLRIVSEGNSTMPAPWCETGKWCGRTKLSASSDVKSWTRPPYTNDG